MRVLGKPPLKPKVAGDFTCQLPEKARAGSIVLILLVCLRKVSGGLKDDSLSSPMRRRCLSGLVLQCAVCILIQVYKGALYPTSM